MTKYIITWRNGCMTSEVLCDSTDKVREWFHTNVYVEPKLENVDKNVACGTRNDINFYVWSEDYAKEKRPTYS